MRKLLVLLALAAVGGVLATSAFAASKSVRVGDNFFRSSSVTVKRGTTVKWRFQGRAPHNVTVTRGPQRFRSKTMRRGTYSKRVTRKGSYTIVCTLHSGMRMRLRVR